MIPVPMILTAVAMAHGLTLAEMLVRTRKRAVSRPRQAAMFLVRELRPDLSLPRIGRALGDFDHTSILAGIVATGRRMALCPELVARMDTARLSLLKEIVS